MQCRLILNDSGTPVIFQIDSGASLNILPSRYHSEHLPLDPPEKNIRSWNDSKVTPLGTYVHRVRNPVNGNVHRIKFVIVKENYQPILGYHTCESLKFITINDEAFQRVHSIRSITDDFGDVFDNKLYLAFRLSL